MLQFCGVKNERDCADVDYNLESQVALKHKTKKEARGAQTVRRKRGPASRIYKRSNVGDYREEKAEQKGQNIGQNPEQSQAPIETI
jgi:hypothetical protein